MRTWSLPISGTYPPFILEPTSLYTSTPGDASDQQLKSHFSAWCWVLEAQRLVAYSDLRGLMVSSRSCLILWFLSRHAEFVLLSSIAAQPAPPSTEGQICCLCEEHHAYLLGTTCFLFTSPLPGSPTSPFPPFLPTQVESPLHLIKRLWFFYVNIAQ